MGVGHRLPPPKTVRCKRRYSAAAKGKRLLPDWLSPHGLRKAACRRMAEGGGTPHQIMAISGHKTLGEVTRYTVAASRRMLAKQAVATLDSEAVATV